MSGGAVKFRPISPPLQGRAAKLGSLLPSCSGWGPTASREADRPHPNPSPEGEGLIACSFGARRIRSARMTTTDPFALFDAWFARSEEHTSELQSLMRISYAVFCLKKKNTRQSNKNSHQFSTTTTPDRHNN